MLQASLSSFVSYFIICFIIIQLNPLVVLFAIANSLVPTALQLFLAFYTMSLCLCAKLYLGVSFVEVFFAASI